MTGKYEILYPLSDDEYNALEADIKQNGILTPIIVDEHNDILDGHHRHKIDPNAPRNVLLGLSEAEKLAYVYKCNLARRNASKTQQAEYRIIQQGLAEQLRKENKTQQEIADILGVSRQTIDSWLNISNASNSNTYTYDQRVKLPEEAQEVILDRVEEGEKQTQVAADYGVTQPAISQVVKKQKRKREVEEQKQYLRDNPPEPPDGLFETIVIDPPWAYGTPYDPDGRRAASPYPEMNLDEIANIELPATDDCILWLWTTHKFMRHSFDLLDTWGFRDVAIVTWVKDRMGLGAWLRSQSEFCIMAVKGKPLIELTNQTTIIQGKMREHSRKPDEFYQMVDGLCVGRKLDYFSREAREGWESFGDEPNKYLE